MYLDLKCAPVRSDSYILQFVKLQVIHSGTNDKTACNVVRLHSVCVNCTVIFICLHFRQ